MALNPYSVWIADRPSGVSIKSTNVRVSKRRISTGMPAAENQCLVGDDLRNAPYDDKSLRDLRQLILQARVNEAST